MKRISILSLLSFFLTYNIFAQNIPPAPVVVEEVREVNLKTPVTFVGEVEPIKRSLIASEIEGLVKNYPAEEGKFFNKGELLAAFSTRSLQLDLKEAIAAKEEAKARYSLANKNYKRFSELHDKGIASLQELQDAESERGAFVARIAQFQAQIDSNKYDISRSRIKAPFNGFVTKEHTEIGQWVNKGGAIVELVDISSLKVKVDVPERHINKIKVKDRVRIFFDALPNTEIEGEVSSIVPQAELEARTFPVEVKIPNEKNIIKSGMVARMSFMIGDETLSNFIPKDAVVNQAGNTFVYIVVEGIVKPVPIKVGIAYNDMLQALGPLEKGQLVVTRGNERLRPDQPVKVVNK